MDIGIQDDPRNPQRKIFFYYDVSEVYDLRRLLDKKSQFHNLVGKSKNMQRVYEQIRELSKRLFYKSRLVYTSRFTMS